MILQQFQQFFVLKMPQIRFVGSGWIFLLCRTERYAQCQTVHMTVETLQVPLLDWFLTCPLLCNARCTVSVVKVVDIPVVTQAILMVSTVLNTKEILQLQFIDKVFDVSVVQVQQVLGCSLWRQSRSHSCSSLIVDPVVHMPVVAQRQVPNGSDVRKL